jgi:hypothetical protein
LAIIVTGPAKLPGSTLTRVPAGSPDHDLRTRNGHGGFDGRQQRLFADGGDSRGVSRHPRLE